MKRTMFLKAERIGYYLKVYPSLLWILLLSIITIFSRVMLLVLVPGPMFYYDSYYYFSQASDFISKGLIPSDDPVFSILLGLWIAVFRVFSDPLIVARFFTITLTLITSFLVFNLARKFLGDEFAFTATTLIMLEPILLSFSITTHNDVFAMMNAMLSLNFAVSQRRILSTLGMPVTFLLAVWSKPFLYIVLGIPLILIYAYRILKSKKSRKLKIVVLLFGLTVYSLAPLSPFGQQYYYTQTRFDPITKVKIFLRPEIIQFVTDKIFLITNINFINITSQALFIVGNLLIAYAFAKRFKRNGNVVNQGITEFLPLFMLIIVYLSILTFSVFTMGYRIVGGTVIPDMDLSIRYVIWPRFAVLWINAFALWEIISIIARHRAAET